MSQNRPNVLLLHSHDLGRHLGCYGWDVETPHIDSLAAGGVRFSDYFCTAPQCSPSRASIMTGRYPHRAGMLGLANLGWQLNEDAVPLPALLADAGYDTHQFGVQHLARGSRGAADLGYGTEHEEASWKNGLPTVDRVTPAVTDFLDEWSGDESFLASVGFFEPHRLGREAGRGFVDSQYEPDDPGDVDELPYLPDHPDIREDHAEFHGMVRALDDAVGDIMDALESAGLTEETLVVFTSDHGIPFPRAKGSCTDAGLGTALVMSHPAFEPAVRDELLSNVDLLPTLCEFLDLPVPEGVDGRSFLPLLTGEGEFEPRERIFAEMTYHLKYVPMRAVRTDRYKYIRNLGTLPETYLALDVRHGKAGIPMLRESYRNVAPDEELYDLTADPHEQENLADDPAHSEALEELRADLDDWMERTDDPLLEGDVDPPQKQQEGFRSPWM